MALILFVRSPLFCLSMRLPISARALPVVTRYRRQYHNLALLVAYDIQKTTKY
jgi:hypothetical protein